METPGKGPREWAAVLCLPPMLARAPAGREPAGRDPPPVLSGGGRAGRAYGGRRKETGGEGKKKEKERTRAGPRLRAAGVPSPAHVSPHGTERRGARAQRAPGRPRAPEGRAPRGGGRPPGSGRRRRRAGTPARAASGSRGRDGGPDPRGPGGLRRRRPAERARPRSRRALGPDARAPPAAPLMSFLFNQFR